MLPKTDAVQSHCLKLISEITASFISVENLLDFVFDCNSALLWQTYDEKANEVVEPQQYLEIYENLWFTNWILPYLAIPWQKNELQTKEQAYDAADRILGITIYNKIIYADRLSALQEALTHHKYGKSALKTYIAGITALSKLDIFLELDLT